MSNKKLKKPSKKVIHRNPPSFPMLPVQSMTFRFISQNSSGQTVYRRSLLCLIMTQGVANVLTSLFQSVRLKTVEVWGASLTSDINYNTVSVEWEDPRGAIKVISDTGTVSNPAHIRTKPPKETTAAMWSTFNTTYVNEPLFFIIAPVGTIVDVTINFIIANGTTANVSYITRTDVVATLGLFYLSLDNSSAAGGAGTNQLDPLTPVLTATPTS